MYLPELLSIQAGETGGRQLGRYRAEAHEALGGPLYVLTLPLIAVAFVVGAGFRRQGFVGRIILATGAAVALRILGLAIKAAASSQLALWPAMYAPPILGMAAALWLLAGWPLPWRRRGSKTGSSAPT
jgi:lipopolysaccharide export LptBFGC system permease protein LptF